MARDFRPRRGAARPLLCITVFSLPHPRCRHRGGETVAAPAAVRAARPRVVGVALQRPRALRRPIYPTATCRAAPAASCGNSQSASRPVGQSAHRRTVGPHCPRWRPCRRSWYRRRDSRASPLQSLGCCGGDAVSTSHPLRRRHRRHLPRQNSPGLTETSTGHGTGGFGPPRSRGRIPWNSACLS